MGKTQNGIIHFEADLVHFESEIHYLAEYLPAIVEKAARPQEVMRQTIVDWAMHAASTFQLLSVSSTVQYLSPTQ